MENVKLEVSEGTRLTIEVDLNHRGDISASGKTKRVASTQGNVSVMDTNGVEGRVAAGGCPPAAPGYGRNTDFSVPPAQIPACPLGHGAPTSGV